MFPWGCKYSSSVIGGIYRLFWKSCSRVINTTYCVVLLFPSVQQPLASFIVWHNFRLSRQLSSNFEYSSFLGRHFVLQAISFVVFSSPIFEIIILLEDIRCIWPNCLIRWNLTNSTMPVFPIISCSSTFILIPTVHSLLAQFRKCFLIFSFRLFSKYVRPFA